MYCAQFLLKKHCVLDWLSPNTFLFIVAKWWISLDNVKKILLPVVLILQLCMSVQILHTFFNAGGATGLMPDLGLVSRIHSLSNRRRGVLNLMSLKSRLRAVSYFSFESGRSRACVKGEWQSRSNLSSFLPSICIVSLFCSPHGNEERRTTARGLPKEWPTSIFMLNKIDIIIIKGKVHEN